MKHSPLTEFANHYTLHNHKLLSFLSFGWLILQNLSSLKKCWKTPKQFRYYICCNFGATPLHHICLLFHSWFFSVTRNLTRSIEHSNWKQQDNQGCWWLSGALSWIFIEQFKFFVNINVPYVDDTWHLKCSIVQLAQSFNLFSLRWIGERQITPSRQVLTS